MQSRGGQIRVEKKACLLWQSPRPSVLPRSTSCSKADLRETQTSWSAQENKTRLCGLATPSKAAEKPALHQALHPLCLHSVWAAEILILEDNQRTPSKCPRGPEISVYEQGWQAAKSIPGTGLFTSRVDINRFMFHLTLI